MVTSFFGAESFGGDAAYVDRLSGALLRAGHQVEVVHSPAAYEAVRGVHPGRRYVAPPGLEVHSIESTVGRLAPVWTHQTGAPGPHGRRLDEILASGSFDVAHLHNISLLGGPRFIERAAAACPVTLVSANDHYNVCPLGSLWRAGGGLCTEPRCIRCTVRAGRPPQLWRLGSRMRRGLSRASAIVYPSEHTRQLHEARGVRCDSVVLPYFIPATAPPEAERAGGGGRPYVAAAGRLVDEKGFDELLAAISGLEQADLVIAGVGPEEQRLKERAAPMGNVRFVGLLDDAEIRALFASAVAVAVPSEFWETFGYVVAESAAVGTPTIVRDRGPLAEHAQILGSPTFSDVDDLRSEIERLIADPSERARLGDRARTVASEVWSESDHVERYVALVERLRAKRSANRGR